MTKGEMGLQDITIGIFGKSGVGKTSLLHRYIHNEFKKFDPTIEDQYEVVKEHPDGSKQNIYLLDTGGDPDSQSELDEWIRKCDGFIIVYNISERGSFQYIYTMVQK
eukprot:UN34651